MAKTLPKVSVCCPHCGFYQPEPASILSTYCRECGLYYEVGDPPRPPLTKQVAEAWEDVRQRLRPPPPARRWVTCFECGYHQRVSIHAFSTICPGCGSYMALRDIEVTSVFSRAVKTRGKITVHSGGELKCSKVMAHEITVEGVAFSDFDCSGVVHVKAGGVLGGQLRCAHLIVARGGNIDRVRLVEAREISIDARANMKELRALKINVGPHGHIEGNIRVEAFNVEEGGHFSGDLRIGPVPERERLTQGAWLAQPPPLLRAPNVDAEPLVEELLATRGVARL